MAQRINDVPKPEQQKGNDRLTELLRRKLPFNEDAIKETKGGKVIVDWVEIAKMHREARSGTPSDSILHGTYSHLVDLGVLSTTEKGNFQLIGSGVLLNPRSFGLTPLYFTSKADAEAYQRAEFGRALYKINISQIC